MQKAINIGVYYEPSDHNEIILLTDTSEYLNVRQLIPAVGDTLTLYGKDDTLIKSDKKDFSQILTVKRRKFHFQHYDVAIMCEYD